MCYSTKKKIADCVRQLMKRKEISKITIGDIMEATGMSRQSFYYHFKDIYDLVEWSCLEDARKALEEKKTHDTWQEGFLNIFEAVLANVLILSSFIPMITGSGGNAGSQASVSVIRALSLGEIHFRSIFLVLWKEFRVSILCGITLAAANFVKLLLFDLNGQENAFMIALVISLTLVGTIIMAKLVGSSLPLLASKVGFDPAVMANPLISTVCDSLSLLIYFGVAKLILHL